MGSLPCWTSRKQESKWAKNSTTLHTKETPTQADSLKKLLNHKIAIKYTQEAAELATTKKWTDIHKIWAEYKGKPRKKAVANFRHKTGHDCTAAHSRKNGICESIECVIHQMPNSTMDKERLLHCPEPPGCPKLTNRDARCQIWGAGTSP